MMKLAVAQEIRLQKGQHLTAKNASLVKTCSRVKNALQNRYQFNFHTMVEDKV